MDDRFAGKKDARQISGLAARLARSRPPLEAERRNCRWEMKGKLMGKMVDSAERINKMTPGANRNCAGVVSVHKMVKKIFKSFILVVFVSLIFSGPSYASTLWYNGDFNDQSALANSQNSAVTTYSHVYDDFVVDGSGWTINRVWSNNLINFTATAAAWEIRSGVSSGNGGILEASGTSPVTQTLTGRSGFGYDEYTILVEGLSTYLSPGTYWLSVVPVGSGSGSAYLSTTGGANAIGQPAGNNGNAFWDSAFFGRNYFPTAQYQSNLIDFSMGIDGIGGNPVVPEPATLSLLGLGLLGLIRRKLFRKAYSV